MTRAVNTDSDASFEQQRGDGPAPEIRKSIWTCAILGNAAENLDDTRAAVRWAIRNLASDAGCVVTGDQSACPKELFADLAEDLVHDDSDCRQAVARSEERVARDAVKLFVFVGLRPGTEAWRQMLHLVFNALHFRTKVAFVVAREDFLAVVANIDSVESLGNVAAQDQKQNADKSVPRPPKLIGLPSLAYSTSQKASRPLQLPRLPAYAIGNAPESRNVAFAVIGHRRSGKTWLLRWLLRDALARRAFRGGYLVTPFEPGRTGWDDVFPDAPEEEQQQQHVQPDALASLVRRLLSGELGPAACSGRRLLFVLDEAIWSEPRPRQGAELLLQNADRLGATVVLALQLLPGNMTREARNALGFVACAGGMPDPDLQKIHAAFFSARFPAFAEFRQVYREAATTRSYDMLVSAPNFAGGGPALFWASSDKTKTLEGEPVLAALPALPPLPPLPEKRKSTLAALDSLERTLNRALDDIKRIRRETLCPVVAIACPRDAGVQPDGADE